MPLHLQGRNPRELPRHLVDASSVRVDDVQAVVAQLVVVGADPRAESLVDVLAACRTGDSGRVVLLALVAVVEAGLVFRICIISICSIRHLAHRGGVPLPLILTLPTGSPSRVAILPAGVVAALLSLRQIRLVQSCCKTYLRGYAPGHDDLRAHSLDLLAILRVILAVKRLVGLALVVALL